MSAKFARDGTQRGAAEALKGWAMPALTFAFLLLYAAALTGLIRPPDNDHLVWRLEPLIFVVVGYFFGRLPSQQNERTLREEINRQTQRADAAQHAREQAQQSREGLEEKVKNARIVLAATGTKMRGPAGPGNRDEPVPAAVKSALNILDS